MPYFVCLKCGLPRKVVDEKADLGGCECLGDTVFTYEELPRSRDEAIVIGVRHFLSRLVLIIRQGRADAEVNQSLYKLIEKYKKVLDFEAVYIVCENEGLGALFG